MNFWRIIGRSIIGESDQIWITGCFLELQDPQLIELWTYLFVEMSRSWTMCICSHTYHISNLGTLLCFFGKKKKHGKISMYKA